MGTSQSSNGSPSGVPMVPPWVPDVDDQADGAEGNSENHGENGQASEEQDGNIEPQNSSNKIEIAPAGRFRSARRNLNLFAKHGDSSSMKRGVGQYFKKGYGGSKAAVRRFGGTISTGGSLYSALSGVSSGDTVQGFNPSDLANSSSEEIVDQLIEVIRPIDGTQDTEASRQAIQTAFSELLAMDESIDLLNLTPENCLLVTERFIADDVFRRLELDVGKSIQKNAPSIITALGRLREVKNYIRQTVAASFRKLENAGNSPSSTTIRNTIKSVLSDTFSIFEEYIQ